MNVLRTIADLRRVVAARQAHRRIGFVPTMGALHDGHVALFRAAKAESDEVVASIFVNPKQFNDSADLSRYPRPEEQDIEIARAPGVDVLFIPSIDEMYPADHATTVTVAGPAIGFEGEGRPGHFDGVAIVCVKLFGLVQPTAVYLGQKDAQQVAVLRQLVRDTNLPVEIRVVPTVRDPNGLALSSRNARLSADERARALAIPRALEMGLAAHQQGDDPVAAARAVLAGMEVDYVGLATFEGQPTLVVAVKVGTTRLIDNVPLRRPDLAGLQPS